MNKAERANHTGFDGTIQVARQKQGEAEIEIKEQIPYQGQSSYSNHLPYLELFSV